MKPALVIAAAAFALSVGGCQELPMRGIRMELDAGQPIAVSDAPGVWEPQIRVRNYSTQTLNNVRIIINPGYAQGKVAPDTGYRFELPEPLESGAEPRIPKAAFRNKGGRSFLDSGNEIIRIRLECDEGYHEQAGVNVFRPPSSLDILPVPSDRRPPAGPDAK